MSSFGGSVPFAYRAHPATKPVGWAPSSPTDTASTYSTALATINDSATAFVTNVSIGRYVFTHEKPVIQIAFVVTDADNEVAVFGVYGIKSHVNGGTAYDTATLLLNGTATAGSKLFLGAANNFWADTITVSAYSLPTTAFRSINTTNDLSWLEVDTRDFERVMIVCNVNGASGGTAASVIPLVSYGTL